MPESKNRRSGRPRTSRSRRGEGASRLHYAGTRPSSPGGRRFGIRPRTWRKIRRWSFFGIAGLIAVVIIGSFTITTPGLFGGGGGNARGTGAAVGERVDLMPIQFQPSNHIPGDQNYSEYNTKPPTSGPHWSQRSPAAPAPCRMYDEEIRDERVVHNMEHGHVIISHNLQDPAQIDRLKQAAQDLPARRSWVLLRSYSEIEVGEVAVTSWGWLQRFQGVDEQGIRNFYDAHRGQGPEFDPCA